MSVELPHSKAIAVAAREILGPLGLQRKGRSRTWLDDRGWWVGIVEFQPSSYGRGTYLNVAVHWLWSHEGYISLDYGWRVKHEEPPGRFQQFWESAPDEDFTPVARFVAELARDKVLELRATFIDPVAAAHVIDAHRTIEKLFDLAVLMALSGRTADARSCIAEYVHAKETTKYPNGSEPGRIARAENLEAILTDRQELVRWVTEQLQAGRDSLKLGTPEELPVQLA